MPRHARSFFFAALLAAASPLFAADIHVAVAGDDKADGSAAHPLKTISAAAQKAMPGDTVVVHAGVYRERVSPPRGGTDETHRITYEAAPGEPVTITGSEPVKGWTKVSDDTWKVVIPNSFFGAFNPFADEVRGEWFNPNGRKHHTGAVHCDGVWMSEAAALADTLKPAHGIPRWFAEVGKETTVVHAQFPGKDPNAAQTEVNARQTVFYPEKNYINYITVRGFTLENASPNWAPPTREQKAIVGPNWARGWIIENNTVRHAVCSGVSLGKYREAGDDSVEVSAARYDNCIEHARKNGWDKVGHHIVRGNHISECEQTAIVGTFGASWSVIERNHIHDIHVRRAFGGAEQAGIKFHAPVDTIIRDNYLHHCVRGMHLDWMTQGTRISGNLCHDNGGRPSSGKVGFFEAGGGQDIFLEVNHGPCVVDNNILLSSQSVFNASNGTLFAHNLLRTVSPTMAKWLPRKTPVLAAHGIAHLDSTDNRGGDDRFLNNLFIPGGSLKYFDDKAALPVMMEGNVFTKGCTPSKHEKEPLTLPDFTAGARLEQRADGVYLLLATDAKWAEHKRRLATGDILGKTASGLAYENADGSPVRIDSDYLGKKRDAANPFPGPFESATSGAIKIWPK